MLDDWVITLSRALGLEPDDVVVTEILDLAKEAAHNVARPAAPLTTFIVGYAAGLRGGGRETIVQAVQQALAAIEAQPVDEAATP
jgi:hypothetical protein